MHKELLEIMNKYPDYKIKDFYVKVFFFYTYIHSYIHIFVCGWLVFKIRILLEVKI